MTPQTQITTENLMEYREYFLEKWGESLGNIGGELAKDIDGLINILDLENKERTEKMVAEAIAKHNEDTEAHLPIRSMIDRLPR